ncbi:MAG: hypothetical protein ACKOW9_00160, partial [Candidatus Paceibacterota bacterium]
KVRRCSNRCVRRRKRRQHESLRQPLPQSKQNVLLQLCFYRRALLFTPSRSASGGSEKTDLWYDGFAVRNLPNEYHGAAVESFGSTTYPLNLNGVACVAWSYKGAGLLLLDKSCIFIEGVTFKKVL